MAVSEPAAHDIVLRAFGDADVVAYRDLMLEAYADPPPGAVPAFTSSARERAALPLRWWRERIAGRDGCGIGAFRGDAIVGAAALAVESKARTAHKALVVGMYVRPGARGQGVALRMLQALTAQARGRGVRLLQLGVIEGNDAALSLYRRAGFEVFGREPMAVREGGRFHATLHLWRRLDGGP